MITTSKVRDYEGERLERLYGYNIINDYEKVGAFQHVVGMTAHIFKVPIAVVNLVSAEKVLTKSAVGINNHTELNREDTICSHAVKQDQVTVFRNVREEPCLLNNPFVHGEFGLHFYAAAPLKTPDGFNIGVLAIADKEQREFTLQDEQMLEALAAVVMAELEKRKFHETADCNFID